MMTDAGVLLYQRMADLFEQKYPVRSQNFDKILKIIIDRLSMNIEGGYPIALIDLGELVKKGEFSSRQEASEAFEQFFDDQKKVYLNIVKYGANDYQRDARFNLFHTIYFSGYGGVDDVEIETFEDCATAIFQDDDVNYVRSLDFKVI